MCRPFQLEQSNFFLYARNNPLIYIDPFGLMDCVSLRNTIIGGSLVALGGALILTPEPTFVSVAIGAIAVAVGAKKGMENYIKLKDSIKLDWNKTNCNKKLELDIPIGEVASCYWNKIKYTFGCN